jgi:hypothetical protein
LTTSETVIRIPRMQARPPITAGSNVIRSNIGLVYQPEQQSESHASALEGPVARPDETGGTSAFSRVICRKSPEGHMAAFRLALLPTGRKAKQSDYSSVGSGPSGLASCLLTAGSIKLDRQEAFACSLAMRHNRTGVCINGEPDHRSAGRPCAEP